MPTTHVSLYRALRAPNLPDLCALFVSRGLDVGDDPGGFAPSAGVPLTRGGGAYFSTEESYALALAATRRYRCGIVVATLRVSDFGTLCGTNAILPDPLLPGVGVRIQPAGFVAFNEATGQPRGWRACFPPGSALQSGAQVP